VHDKSQTAYTRVVPKVSGLIYKETQQNSSDYTVSQKSSHILTAYNFVKS